MVRLIFSPTHSKILEYQHSNTTGTTVETWPNGRITRRCPSGDTHIKFPDGTHCSSTKRENFNINSLFHVSNTSFKLQVYISYRSLIYRKKITQKSSLKCKIDCDVNSNTNARTQVRKKSPTVKEQVERQDQTEVGHKSM